MWSPSQAAAQRAAKRRSAFYSRINAWPFLAIGFVVLIVEFLAEGTTYHQHPWPWVVDLPRSSHAVAQRSAVRDDAMRITMTRDGRVFFRYNHVAPENLPGLIHDALQEGAEKKIYLAVDARSKYGDAARVVEQISLAGIRQICLTAQKPTEQRAASVLP